MREIIWGVVKVCQQLPDPLHGVGTGGNRCEPSCAAMLDCTFKIGPSAQQGKDPQAIMQDFARWKYNGALSGPPEGPWLGDWLKQHSGGKIFLQAIANDFETVARTIQSGNIIYAGVDSYMRLLDYSGGDPYSWKEDPSLPEGHVFLISGYDDNFRNKYGQTAIINDPLQGTLTHQPWDYRWSSLIAAGLHLYKVVAPPLKVTDESPQPVTPPPPTPPDPATQLAAWQAFGDSVEKLLLTFPKPPA